MKVKDVNMTITITFDHADEYEGFCRVQKEEKAIELCNLRQRIADLQSQVGLLQKELASNQSDYRFNLYDLKVILQSMPSFFIKDKLFTIKLVRSLTQMGLKEAKDWVEATLDYTKI